MRLNSWQLPRWRLKGLARVAVVEVSKDRREKVFELREQEEGEEDTGGW